MYIFTPGDDAGHPRWASSNTELGLADQNWPEFVHHTAANVAVVIDLTNLHAIFESESPEARPSGETIGIIRVDLDTGHRHPVGMARPIDQQGPGAFGGDVEGSAERELDAVATTRGGGGGDAHVSANRVDR